MTTNSEGHTEGWQPIETAPKDGTVVDLWADGGRWADCRWGRPAHSCGEEGQHCDSDWHRTEAGWINGYGGDFLSDYLFGEPTHWMLPPGPPASTATPSEAFSAWLNAGPKLARAAGCHVGIKVTAIALATGASDVRG